MALDLKGRFGISIVGCALLSYSPIVGRKDQLLTPFARYRHCGIRNGGTVNLNPLSTNRAQNRSRQAIHPPEHQSSEFVDGPEPTNCECKLPRITSKDSRSSGSGR